MIVKGENYFEINDTFYNNFIYFSENQTILGYHGSLHEFFALADT